MDLDEIKRKVATNAYVYSQHADIERKAEGLTFAQVEEALLKVQRSLDARRLNR